MQVNHTAPPPRADLRRYTSILWRRKWWIVVPVLVFSLAAFGWSNRKEPRYRAAGELLVTQVASTGVPFLDQSLSDEAERTVENEIELLLSRDTADRVTAAIGRQVAIEATTTGDSDVITLTSEGPDADRAAADINDFAEQYIRQRRNDRIRDLQQVRRQVVADRESVRVNLAALEAPIRRIEQLIEVTPAGPERDRLFAERDAARDQNNFQRSSLNLELSQLNSTLDAVDGAVELTDGGLQLITAASPPSERYTPQPKKDALVAASIALLFGLGLAFASEFAFDRVTTQEDVEEALPGDRFLGAVPVIDVLAARDTALLGFGREQSIGAEAYRALAASIEFAGLDKPVAIIHLTSPVAGEGKSTTAANLAAAFAETGAKVAIVDADVRRPELYRILKANNDVGLSSVLLGRTTLTDALQDVPGLPGVRLLSPGPLPANPTKMLYAQRTEDVFDELRASYDVVIVDGPPVLPVADALILTQFSDMTVLVLRSGSTRRRALRRSRHALARVDAADLAIVLNAAPLSGPDGYGYYGTYYATKDEEAEEPSRRSRWARD